MNCWEVLVIEPTNDKKAIKRAYAKKLKVTHPEDDPVAFQELSEAYQSALNIADYLELDESVYDEVEHDVVEPNKVIVNSESKQLIDSIPQAEKIELTKPSGDIEKIELIENLDESFNSNEKLDLDENKVAEISASDTDSFIDYFLARMNSLYRNSDTKNDIELWNDLFTEPMLDDIEIKQRLRYQVFDFFSCVLEEELQSKTKDLFDKNIVYGASEFFDWREDEISLTQYFGHESVDIVMSRAYGNANVSTDNVESKESSSGFSVSWFFWIFIIYVLTKLFASLAK